jgi:hypothetical protein
LNPQGSSLARFRVGCRRQSACPSPAVDRGDVPHQALTIKSSTGGRSRTSNRRLNRAPPYRWATPVSNLRSKAIVVPLRDPSLALRAWYDPRIIPLAGASAWYGRESAWPDLNRRSPAPEAGGFNQAFLHAGQSAQRESNPRFRHGKAVGFHYNMGTAFRSRIVKETRAPGGTRTHVAALRVRSLGR